MSDRPTLLLTGPIHSRSLWARAAERAGWRVIERALLSARAEQFTWPDAAVDWLAVTSASACASLAEHSDELTRQPAAVVGERSAEWLRERGVDVQVGPAINAAELLERWPVDRLAGTRILWPHSDRSRDLADQLRARGADVIPRLAYRTIDVADSSPLPNADAVFVASPSAAERALELLDSEPERWIAIGKSTERALRARRATAAYDAPRIATLQRPTPEALECSLSELR